MSSLYMSAVVGDVRADMAILLDSLSSADDPVTPTAELADEWSRSSLLFVDEGELSKLLPVLPLFTVGRRVSTW